MRQFGTSTENTCLTCMQWITKFRFDIFDLIHRGKKEFIFRCDAREGNYTEMTSFYHSEQRANAGNFMTCMNKLFLA